MAKQFNRFYIDTSGSGKFSDHVVIHTQDPMFIARVSMFSKLDHDRLISEAAALPMHDLLFAAKTLSSGKVLAVQAIKVWGDIESSNAAMDRMRVSMRLSLNAYYARIIDEVKQADVDFDELDDCIEFINTSIRNSELKYHTEKTRHADDELAAYRQNIIVAKRIRKYLKKLWELNGRLAGRF